MIRRFLVVAALIVCILSCASSFAAADSSTATWHFKHEMFSVLVDDVPRLLKAQNPKTGRFGSGTWIPADQFPIYALATVWSTKDSANPYYHDRKLLEAIIKGGDTLIGAQEKDGQWMFRKKDNSEWGMHYDPWVYSRWIRTFSLIRESMPKSKRAAWEKALTLGYSGVARRELSRIVNIPTHHAMGLYIAGRVLNRPEWCAKASEFLHRVARAQDPNGFWSEHYGPVVAYNFVYIDALGIYYAISHDADVLPALERGAKFHANFIYPDGTLIETIDERNPYSLTGHLAGPGFSFSPEGRAYLRQQWNRTKDERVTLNIDTMASMVLYGEEGAVTPLPSTSTNPLFRMADGRAAVLHQSPWCAAFSAYVCPIDGSRWIQDRQNFVSLFHDKTGLILGGGNTKLQPLWSTFTVGDTKLLQHQPGDKHPNFAEPRGLIHVPSQANLDHTGTRLQLRYGNVDCGVALKLLQTNQAQLTYTADTAATNAPIAAHVTLLPNITNQWHTASGKSGTLEKPFNLTADEAGAWFEHNGWRVQLPQTSELTWPVLRHNPYRDDGRSDLTDARIVLTLPFTKTTTNFAVDITVLR